MKLYQHNQIAYDRLVLNLKTNHKTCIIQPTGTGKSYIVAELLKDNPSLQFLIISANSYIKNQFVENFSEITNFNFITYPHLISKEFNNLFNENYDYIILDEFHRGGALLWGKKLNTLLSYYASSKVVGLTATHIRYSDDNRNMAEELFNNNIAHNLSIYECFDKGILPRPKYISAIYDLNIEYEKLLTKINKSMHKNKSVLKKQILEKKLAFENSKGIDVILKKHITTERNFIIFCPNIEKLESLIPVFKAYFEKMGITNIYRIYSTLLESESEFNNFKVSSLQGNNNFNLLFSIDQLNEGLHLTNIDGVIFIRNTESPIIYYQQLGRCLSSKGKQPIVFDLVNNFKISTIHESEFKRGSYKECIQDYLKEDYSKYIYEFTVIDEVKEIQDLFPIYNFNPWEEIKDLIKEYHKLFNKLPQPGDSYNGIAIGNWLKYQKQLFKNSKLSEEKINSLIDIQPDILDLKGTRLNWEESLDLLKEFYQLFERLPKSCESYKGVGIEIWLRKQRVSYKKTKLSEEQIKSLIDVQPDIFDLKGNQFNWEESLDLLKEFYQSFERLPKSRESYKGVGIGIWLRYQKQYFKNSKLSEEKIKLLINIKHDILTLKDRISWEDCLNLFKEFYEVFHRTPKDNESYKGVDVGNWLESQRQLFKNSKLSEEKIKSLLKIYSDILKSKNPTK